MKKRILSAFIAGVMGAMFGLLYPEYILLPDTYQYIEEMDCQKQWIVNSEENDSEIIKRLLHCDSKRIVISSRLLQFLADEGIILWKNINSDTVNMR